MPMPFGTRGSQVQILPLRPTLSSPHKQQADRLAIQVLHMPTRIPTTHHDLWPGIDLKLDIAFFHYERMGNAVSRPSRRRITSGGTGRIASLKTAGTNVTTTTIEA
jgi:hypothetical protein